MHGTIIYTHKIQYINGDTQFISPILYHNALVAGDERAEFAALSASPGIYELCIPGSVRTGGVDAVWRVGGRRGAMCWLLPVSVGLSV